MSMVMVGGYTRRNAAAQCNSLNCSEEVMWVLRRAAATKNATLKGDVKHYRGDVSSMAISMKWRCQSCEEEHQSNNLVVGYSTHDGVVRYSRYSRYSRNSNTDLLKIRQVTSLGV